MTLGNSTTECKKFMTKTKNNKVKVKKFVNILWPHIIIIGITLDNIES